MRFNQVKKILILMGAAGMVSLSAISPLRAQAGLGDTAILAAILDRVNNLPKALEGIGTLTAAWMDPDTSDASIAMQGNFSQLGDLLSADTTQSLTTQGSLNTFLLSNNGDNIYSFNAGVDPTTDPGYKPVTPKTLPYANDLAFTSVLGTPVIKETRKGVDSSMNYIMNASGSNIAHVIPGISWQGKIESQRRYQSFYNTVMAATSYNNYILSYYATDKGQFNTLQNTLIKQASDPKTWFAKVSSENIGFVLRQLLMYQSQIFVLLTEVVEGQKQMVSAQAMNTAVLIAINQINEGAMAAYADNKTPIL